MRDVSAAFREALYARSSDDPVIVLAKITHPNLSSDILLANNNEDITSGGDTYIGCPFEIRLPESRDDRVPRASITFDNVDRQIVNAIRSIESDVAIEISLILASAPNTVEISMSFELVDVGYNKQTVSGELSVEDIVNEQFPGDSFTSVVAPGLFA